MSIRLIDRLKGGSIRFGNYLKVSSVQFDNCLKCGSVTEPTFRTKFYADYRTESSR
jgi:hypothetical protein